MSRVVDASVMVAALIDQGPAGIWAESILLDESLSSPHLMPVEVTNVLRRRERSGAMSTDAAALAHVDLLNRKIDLFPFLPFADRVWELRGDISAYDAWYVAIAESLGCNLATLDMKLAKAPGPHCTFETPGSPYPVASGTTSSG